MSLKREETPLEFFHIPDDTEQEQDAPSVSGDTPEASKSADNSNTTGNDGVAVTASTDVDGTEPSGLESLGVRFVDQNSLERTVAQEADKAMVEKDIEVEKKRLDKAQKKWDRLRTRLRTLEMKLGSGSTRISEKQRLREQIDTLERGELAQATRDVSEIKERLRDAENSSKQESSIEKSGSAASGPVQLPGESRQEFLIRSGKITAFGSANKFIEEVVEGENEATSHQNLRMPGIGGESIGGDYDGDFEPVDVASDDDNESPIEELDDDYDLDDDIDVSRPKKKKAKKAGKTQKEEEDNAEEDEFRNIDDGDPYVYKHRVKEWTEKRSALRKLKRPDYVDDPDLPEWRKPHPTINDAILNDEFRIPGDIYPSLFDYQKTGVQWLWELYSQKTGGIIGDEMGLGKTVQIIAFLAGLHYSGKLNGPVLVVCPATVMKQWTNEFHRWWPVFRTVILHSIGSGMAGNGKRGKKRALSEEELADELLEEDEGSASYEQHKSAHTLMTEHRAKELVDSVVKSGHVIITTYAGVRIYSQYLLPVQWEYVVLDEGHKIRNPDSYVTLTCKQLRTPNRIILSGTPIQNNLVELWSLFDFIFPGRLGTLPVFQKQFCIPINLGGYANATNVQVQTGYKCAVILKDLISPYLLRRVKADVAQDLPKKSEMVLFCKLTPTQRTLYKNFLKSEDLERILTGKRNALYGIDVLRKISNHPDLVLGTSKNDEDRAEDVQIVRRSQSSQELANKSGKLQVVKMLLELWNKEDRKALIFTQTRQMLDILQDFMDAMNRENDGDYSYMRMDGTTPISERQSLVDAFNTDPKYKVFLLTTRVGGLGVNLTGASRVIIFDPDWNPSTDMQARERAWRLGQKKDVTIYRLMIAGSIEEKIYHRQIFKQFLTNKILKDPKQKRFFKMTDIHDLFSLGDEDTKGTETADLFGAKETNFEGSKERKSKFLKGSRSNDDVDTDDFMEVSKMKGVASVQEYDTGEGSKPRDKNEEIDETGLVSQIFKRNGGVHSAVEHDSVMNPTVNHSYDVIDTEASRIANSAVNALKQSRRVTKKARLGVPTWTGRFGAAGRTPNNGSRAKRRRMHPGRSGSPPLPAASSSGLSSSAILQTIEKKKRDVGTLKPIGAGLRSRSPSIPPEDAEKTQKLITQLSRYLSGVPGYFSKSGDILDHLSIDVKDEKEVKVLRQMLRSICKWDKQRKGWTLNEEFR